MNSSVAKQEARKDAVVQNEPKNYISPEVNIFETKDGYILEAEMPGVNKEGLDIALEANTMTIHGRRTPQDVKGQALYRESSPADYRRVFELDPAIDTGKIEAKITQGVLTLHLPKSEAVKPRKVTVND
ncbi:MAG TPA: Hsp20/alpha crystallin family protein [Verrucomicrobiae bacterium]|nr:Hsp20/alpha crystallin family protein [Verrucomicrobiae bacterium]